MNSFLILAKPSLHETAKLSKFHSQVFNASNLKFVKKTELADHQLQQPNITIIKNLLRNFEENLCLPTSLSIPNME